MNLSQSRLLMLAIAATAVLGFSSVASAGHGGPGYYRGGPGFSPKQHATVEKYRAEHKKGIPSYGPHRVKPKDNEKGRHDRRDGHRGGWDSRHRG